MEERPDKIFHLAPRAIPPFLGKTAGDHGHQCERHRQCIPSLSNWPENNLPDYDPVVVVACSGAQYGITDTGKCTHHRRRRFYAAAPVWCQQGGAGSAVHQYFRSDGSEVSARIFNTQDPEKPMMGWPISPTGPGSLNWADCRRCGWVTKTKRAITDVRDLVQALVLLSDKGHWGKHTNISGNKVYTIAEIIPLIEEVIGREWKLKPTRNCCGPTDEPIIYGDSSRLKAHTGWEQQYDLHHHH